MPDAFYAVLIILLGIGACLVPVYLFLTKDNWARKFRPFGVNVLAQQGQKTSLVENLGLNLDPFLRKAQADPKTYPLASLIDGYGEAVFDSDRYTALLEELATMPLDEYEQQTLHILQALEPRLQQDNRLIVEFLCVSEQ
ncbi:MAG TPA: hypothetical protein VK674_04530 [Candidatus Limnocylindria bacterium]|nr:hypothetical protein [Candidatus Limnocylindria bacterium]